MMLHQALVCPVGFYYLWTTPLAFVMQGSLVGRSNNSSSDAYAAPPDGGEADGLDATVPH